MGRLHLVATPIGNLEDVTLRALRVLGEADLVLAEDTRRTRVLLDRHDVSARPVSLHAHNEASRLGRVLDVLSEGGDVAIVSDAGTPLVSDPGARLAEAALAAGHELVAVPGASAVLAGLSVSGLPTETFTFVGFLPRRAGEADARLAGFVERPETLVLFESPRRLPKTLERLAAVLGDRPACVARELTKLHEEAVRGTLADLAKRFADGARGEVTLIVQGAGASPEPTDDAIDAAVRAGLEARGSARDVAAEVARQLSIPRRRAYARVIALRDASE